MTAANALLSAIHKRLCGDVVLTAIVGPDSIRDRRVARPDVPSIIFGELDSRDYSTSTESGEEHFLTLEIWSAGEGRRQAQHIAGLVDRLLHDADLPLSGAVLVNLTRIGMRAKREPKTGYFLTEMRFRTVTE